MLRSHYATVLIGRITGLARPSSVRLFVYLVCVLKNKRGRGGRKKNNCFQSRSNGCAGKSGMSWLAILLMQRSAVDV